MRDLRKSWLTLSIILIVSILLPFAIVMGFLNFAAYSESRAIIIVACCVVLVGFTFFQVYRDRKISYLPIAFCITGVILVLLGSVIEVPYTKLQTFREDKAYDLTRILFTPDFERPTYDNGSLKPITLAPLETKKFICEKGFSPNSSIIQISTSKQGLILTIADLYWLTYDVKTEFFNHTSPFPISSLFWTPPYDFWAAGFIFKNPNNESVDFTFRVTQYYLKHTENRRVTYYQTPLDLNFAYTGIALVCASVLIDTYSSKKKTPETIS